MVETLLFPLDRIQPSQLLSHYSEWIYFGLLLAFFISIAGITLRRHFGQPYVRPLIISVGLMLTVGAFMTKRWVLLIFEGLGLVGTILLVLIAATIPYGLCRGFGLSAKKAFYLTYILFYILSWLKFSAVYYGLAEHNLGLVNLGLLVLFFFSIYKMVRFPGSLRDIAEDVAKSPPSKPQIERGLEQLDEEKNLVKKQARKITKTEIRTIDDIAEALAEIQRIVQTHRNNLPAVERERLSSLLRTISKKEEIFQGGLQKLQKIFQRVGTVDKGQLESLKDRMAKVSGKEKDILRAEIEREGEKLEIEKALLGIKTRLDQQLEAFNSLLRLALQQLSRSAFSYDAKPHLAKARLVLKDITSLLKETKDLEGKLVRLTKAEKALAQKERRAA